MDVDTELVSGAIDLCNAADRSRLESFDGCSSPPNKAASLCCNREPQRDKLAAVLDGESLLSIGHSPRELFNDFERGIKMVTSSVGDKTGAEAG